MMLRTGETVFLCKSYLFIYFILMLFIDILLCFMQIYVFLIHVLENLRMSFFCQPNCGFSFFYAHSKNYFAVFHSFGVRHHSVSYDLRFKTLGLCAV